MVNTDDKPHSLDWDWQVAKRDVLDIKKEERMNKQAPTLTWRALSVTIDSLHKTHVATWDPLHLEDQYHSNNLWPGEITSWSLDTVPFSETCSGGGLLSSSGASFCCSISSSFRRAFLRLVSAPMMGRLGGGGSGSSTALGFLFCIGQFRFPLWHAQSTL